MTVCLSASVSCHKMSCDDGYHMSILPLLAIQDTVVRRLLHMAAFDSLKTVKIRQRSGDA